MRPYFSLFPVNIAYTTNAVWEIRNAFDADASVYVYATKLDIEKLAKGDGRFDNHYQIHAYYINLARYMPDAVYEGKPILTKEQLADWLDEQCLYCPVEFRKYGYVSKSQTAIEALKQNV